MKEQDVGSLTEQTPALLKRTHSLIEELRQDPRKFYHPDEATLLRCAAISGALEEFVATQTEDGLYAAWKTLLCAAFSTREQFDEVRELYSQTLKESRALAERAGNEEPHLLLQSIVTDQIAYEERIVTSRQRTIDNYDNVAVRAAFLEQVAKNLPVPRVRKVMCAAGWRKVCEHRLEEAEVPLLTVLIDEVECFYTFCTPNKSLSMIRTTALNNIHCELPLLYEALFSHWNRLSTSRDYIRNHLVQ